MKQTLYIISGWAHGKETIRPLGNALASWLDVQLLTGAEVLNKQHIPNADLIITDSMGGLLAIELLPASCKKLVLMSSTAKFCSDETYPHGIHPKILKRMILQLKCDPDAVLKDFYKNVHHPHRAPRTAPECSHAELVSGLEYLLTSDVRKKIPTLKIPVLILHGTHDHIISPAAAEWLHEHLPNSRLHLIDNAGHALPAHQFNEMMDIIAQFL